MRGLGGCLLLASLVQWLLLLALPLGGDDDLALWLSPGDGPLTWSEKAGVPSRLKNLSMLCTGVPWLGWLWMEN